MVRAHVCWEFLTKFSCRCAHSLFCMKAISAWLLTAALLIEFPNIQPKPETPPRADLETMHSRFHCTTPKERLCTPWNSINATAFTPATCGYSWISLGYFYYTMIYHVILRVMSNLQLELDPLQFVEFSSQGHLRSLVDAELLQLRHVHRDQGINYTDFIRLQELLVENGWNLYSWSKSTSLKLFVHP